MPQETNLNVAPYFDDFDSNSSYCKILFKPGTPVQARELTGIQSILQNQIEKFGSHIFKDGASVTGGGVRFNGAYTSVAIEISNEGIDVQTYLADLVSKFVIGSNSGVKAQIKSYIGLPTKSNFYVLFIAYLNTGGEGNIEFSDGESLLLDGDVLSTRNNLIFQPGQPIAQTIPESASSVGAAAILSAGIYFVRGYFVDVPEQTVIISPYYSEVDAKVGLEVRESIVNSDSDESLTDNAAGYSNYTAPGADRLSIEVRLKAIPIEETKPSNFIDLMEVRDGNLVYVRQENDYNELGNELAKRTFDESGNYYVRPFSLTARETLNDYQGNNGIFNSSQVTYNNNVPSDDLATYRLSPGKAYVEGYDVETVTPTFLDFDKPRTTKLLEGQSINYVTGPTFTLNRVSGSPILGIGTDYTVSLRDQRVGAAATTAAGAEIGLARVYDFALESGSYNASNASENEWDIALYDIQTYTKVALNTPATLAVPTQVKGKSSGATGFLRSAVTSSTDVTLYNTKGKFITGEQFIFNGIDSGNISVGSTSYTTSDIKSINGTVSTASTFNADVKLSVFSNIGEVNITNPPSSGASAGISTVTFTDPTKFFVGIATVGNIVEYTNPGKSTVSYARVESVSQHSLTISGVSSVTGICDGGLPSTTINPSNFKILSSQFQSSTDNTLYTELPKDNISNVDLTDSHITIRRQFDVTIASNTTGAVNSGDANQTFLPYDEEDYVLIRTDGTTESLSADKFEFNTGSTTVTVSGLSGSGPAKLIATLRKVKVKEKIKEKQKINILTIANSKDSQSGIGTTTLNDGLTYGTVYGTRVQDEEISLNTPDVTKVYGIYESSNASAPSLPVLTLSSINSDTAKTGDLLIGEKFTGDTSQCCAIYASKNTDSAINYILLNDYSFQVGETVTFEESGITATVDVLAVGSNNITDEFSYDDGQRGTIYDFGRIIRKSEYDAPSKQISIVFESAYFSAADTGDITTVNSYRNFDYKNLHTINDDRVSDILDIRPRVTDFSGTSRSPFEFLGRSFDGDGNSAANILASDGSILLDYSFFLPRFDKIYLSKDGTFQLVKGVPAETPEFPVPIDGALEVAAIKLPAYLYNVNQTSVSLAKYKRYQMSDINRLERRIENLEFYTSLTLLENDTLNMQITDSDGLNRFKSGFFVDDFSNTENQIKTTIVKNSIDYKNGELRPSPYTTELDLQVDLNSANGIRKTGRCLTLDYDDVEYIKQPYATRVENVTPYLVSYYGGTVDLLPSSEVWVNQVILEAKHEDLTTYTESTEQLDASGFDSRTGYGPVTWGSWNDTWTGNETIGSSSSSSWQGNNKVQTTTTTQRKVGTSTRTGSKQLLRETFSTINEGPKVINTEIAAYMRSRNIKFDAKTLRPSTSMYAFFDGQDVAKYIIPKLVEISMTTGTFEVGETVVGTDSNGKELIRFRLAQSNHKRGPFDAPTQTYGPNPYYQFTTLFGSSNLEQQDARLLYSRPIVDTITPTVTPGIIVDDIVDVSPTILREGDSTGASGIVNVPELYSSTSVLLNVDLDTLSTKSDNTFFGYIERNLRLVGQTSNAQATVSELRLKSDNVGNLLGSFFIPNPNDITTPKFDIGKKVFRLTSSALNAQNEGLVTTDATRIFESTGDIETLQSTIISVKNIHTDIITRVESKSITGGTTSSTSSRIVDTRRNSCPTPDMTILMSDGSTKPAGELQVGDEVDTLHEDTLNRGNHKVTYVEILPSDILELDFSGKKIKCSTSHKFYSNNEWVESQDLVIGQKVSLLEGEVEFTGSIELGEGDVVKITVEDAHTYICEGFLSHNKRPPYRPDPPRPCPTPDMTILLSNGSTKPAGELQVGDEVDTLHEDTLNRGNHKVTHAEIVQSSILELDFSGTTIKCSTTHKFYSNNGWVEAQDLLVGQKVSLLDGEIEFTGSTELGEGDVVRIQIEDAHTYICEGFLSHNKTPIPIPPPKKAIKKGLDVFVGLPPEYQAGGKKDMSNVVVGALGKKGVGMSHATFVKKFPKVVDPIAAAYIEVNGDDSKLSSGAALYWTTSIANELGKNASAEAVKKRMVEHIKFANDKKKVKAFEESAAGKKLLAQSKKDIKAALGKTVDFGSMKDPCGMGQKDPLAQSFYVAESNGIFATKVDLYFGTKDDLLPVTVQLRTMKAGVPTTEIIPFSEVVLDPREVNVSTDATAVTTVTFPSPVYLSGGKSYAIVLLSTSTEYTAWISRMGETDVQSRDRPEAEQIIVGVQPTLGSLFKSQNGETWNPSQYEDLKFTLYKAVFKELTGTINFYNPPLLTYSDDVAPLLKDSLEIKSNKIRIGFNTTISDTAVTIGNLISQQGSNATGRYVGSGGTATGNLTITNAGVGYTPSSGATTYNFVPMVTKTGTGRDGTLNMTITNGVAIAATVASGGSGYSVGDVVGVSTVGLTSLGSGIQFSIASITGVNEFILDNVQGEFATGIGKTIQYTAGAAATDLNGAAGGNVFLSGSPAVASDGLHIKVNQKNHGMYSSQNTVTIDGVDTDVPTTQLAAEYSSTSTGSIVLDDATNFAEFENVGIGSTNLGYIKVGSEILSYSGVTANTLTGVNRGVDSTSTLTHDALDFVHKYELNGVSLRRINTNHSLADATVTDPIGLDFYNIKIDMSSNGVDRSTGTSLPKLKFNQTKSTGSVNILSTENIPFDIITPIIQNITPTGTTISGQVRTVTSTSVDGSESPFVDKGFDNITLVGDNYMSSPRMIASRINETTSLPNLPDNKSFTLNLALSALDPALSPMIDLDRMAVIFTSNRLNQPITDYTTDNRINTIQDDPNAFVYASKPITLESGATGIKIHLEGHINLTSDLRAFYAISDNPNDELVYQAFPGYDNLLSTGQIIDPAKNSGLPDKALPKTDVIAYTPDQVVWNDYEFTIDNLATFRYFSIKLVGTGTNSSQPPRVRGLRVIALA